MALKKKKTPEAAFGPFFTTESKSYARSEAGSLLADSLQSLLASLHPRPSPTLQPRGDPRSLGLQCCRKRGHGPGKPPERNLQSYSGGRALQPRKPLMAACPRNNRHTRFLPIHLTVTPSRTRTPTLPSRIPHSTRGGESRGRDGRSPHRPARAPPLPRSAPPAARSPPQELQIALKGEARLPARPARRGARITHPAAREDLLRSEALDPGLGTSRELLFSFSKTSHSACEITV